MFRHPIPYSVEVEKQSRRESEPHRQETPVFSNFLIALNPYCSHCGFLLEPDCDFCPSCGSAKGKSQATSSRGRDPHVWMNNPPPVQVAPGPQSIAAAPQVQYVPYQVHGPTAQGQDHGLGTTVRAMGIVALSLMLVGFIPCLGWLNYINIILSFITLILGIVAIVNAKSDPERSGAILGVVLVVMTIFLGTGRLIIGGGCV